MRMHEAAVTRDIMYIRPFENALPDAFLQAAMCRIQHASEELHAFAARKDHVIVTMQRKGKLTVKKYFHELAILLCLNLSISKDHEVIAVTEIFLDTKRVLHVSIEFVQIDVREYLARHISNGDTARKFNSTLSLSLPSGKPNLWCNYRSLSSEAAS